MNAHHDFRKAALDLLTSGVSLRQKEGQFLGGLAFAESDDLSPKQLNWLSILLRRHDQPPLDGGGS